MFKHKKYVLVNLMVINFGSNCSVKTQKLLRFQAHGTSELQSLYFRQKDRIKFEYL